MSGTKLVVRGAALAGAFVGVLSSVALADDEDSGGVAAPDRPRIEQVLCDGAPSTTCSRGDERQVAGDDLADARALVFLGRVGRRDDRSAAPRRRDAHTLTVTVPSGARSGPVRVVSRTAGASAPGPRVLVRARAATLLAPTAAPAPRVIAGDFVFPIRGKHDLGHGPANNFGGGRDHQGQDMFAACGTPVVAARGGTVEKAAFQSRAGNYVVIADESGQSYVYMHMRRPVCRQVVDHRRSAAVGDRSPSRLTRGATPPGREELERPPSGSHASIAAHVAKAGIAQELGQCG